MKIYLLSIGAGVLIGLIYSMLGVRSPAPPLVALAGLLGILVGEQIIPAGKQFLGGGGGEAAVSATQVADPAPSPLHARSVPNKTGDEQA